MLWLACRRVVAGWLASSVVAGATITAAGCGGESVSDDVAAPAQRAAVPVAELSQATTSEPPAPFITDTAVLGLPTRGAVALRHEASPALFGWMSPLAVPSSDGQSVAYSAWQELASIDPGESFSAQGVETGDALGRPSVRVLDLETGSESLIEDGAYSVAWRSDGAIAYARGDQRDYRANRPYTTDIVVRPSPDGPPQIWTKTPARYTVVAWARDTLLAYEVHDGEQLDVLAVEGPGSVRVLASDASLVAASPDGTTALISDASGPGTYLLDIATGDQLAYLNLASTPLGESGVPNMSYSGSWVGDRIVAESPGGLVVLKASGDTLEVERILGLPKRAFPMGVHEPQFVDSSGSRVIAWAPVPARDGRARGRRHVYVDCTLADATCRVGRPRTDRVFAHVYNPSRPQVP